jgi:nicotinate-nucleotide adenylyltransferase
MRYGVFGGTFNPIHYGHLRAAEEVREALGLDKVLFVPTGVPPLKKSSQIADSGHRFAMTVMAMASHEAFEALDIETGKPGRSYSVDTVEGLGRTYPGAELFFIIGIDAFLDLHLWRKPERLTGLVDFIVISRPGYRFVDLVDSPYLEVRGERLLELDVAGSGGGGPIAARLGSGRTAWLFRVTPYDVSSTAIRALQRREKSIKYLLPEAVESYIMTNGLFAGEGGQA